MLIALPFQEASLKPNLPKHRTTQSHKSCRMQLFSFDGELMPLDPSQNMTKSKRLLFGICLHTEILENDFNCTEDSFMDQESLYLKNLKDP